MARKLDLMDIKQIIRLHLDGQSNRKISRTLGINRNTVNTYIQLVKSLDIPADKLLEKDIGELEKLFPIKTTINNRRYDELMQYLDSLKTEVNKPGFTLLYHYNEYSQNVDNPYSYTQFVEHYNRRYRKVKSSMKLTHHPGETMMIDFAGKHLYLTDRETGEQIPVEIYVSILPHSQYTYVQAVMSQKREDLLDCITGSLAYYGGVPQAIISDNLKSAVSRSSKYEPQINKSLKDLASHYNCVINPTRAYSPQDKALVENAVNLVYQRIYYPLRHMTFFTLGQLNEQIKILLENYNNYQLQNKGISRREQFQSQERSYLKTLPATRYELKNYRRAKVQKMGYVFFSPDKSYYSVPYQYIGQNTEIHYTDKQIEVHYNHQRIAVHIRNKSKGSYNTIKEHLSSTHQFYTDWSPEYFKKLATPHGTYVISYVEQMIHQAAYPETAYKRSMGIIQLHRQYGSERLNNACRRALLADSLSYNRVKNILENNLDKEEFDEANFSETTSHIPPHENIRGAKNYV